jgi:Zn-dependent peptidase ImmA (M78 family)
VPSVVCRSSEAKLPVEWQADFYAACLLMPRKLVFAAWGQIVTDCEQRVVRPSATVIRSFDEGPCFERQIGSPEGCGIGRGALDRIIEGLAQRFLVSRKAMRIRLEKLGLLPRGDPCQRILSCDT